MDGGAPATARLRSYARLQLALGFGCIALLAALLFLPAAAPLFLRVEHWTADWRTAYLSNKAPASDPDIAIVTITDETLKDLPSSPIDREFLAGLVAAIDATHPRAIGIDIFFLKKTADDKDEMLVAALKTAGPVVLGAIDERGDLQPFQRDFQQHFLERTGRDAGYLNLRHEPDDVVRYAAAPAPSSTYPKSFARLLAEAAGRAPVDRGAPIPWRLPPGDGSENFLKIPAQDILAGASKAALLKDKLVLIGGDFPLRDRHRVPLSVRDGQTMPGVLIHAHILSGMLSHGREIAELSPATEQALLAVAGFCGFLLGWFLWQSSLVGYLRWSFATGVLVAIDALCFRMFNLLLPFTLALTAWVLGTYAGSAFRHALARRAREA